MHLIYREAVDSPAWRGQEALEQVTGNKTGDESGGQVAGSTECQA